MGLSIILTTAVNAITPIILMILLGYFLKCRGFLSKEFLKIGNKLVFNVCLPAMLFINVYDIADFASINWEIVLYCVAVLMVIFGAPASVSSFAMAHQMGGDHKMASMIVVFSNVLCIFTIFGFVFCLRSLGQI